MNFETLQYETTGQLSTITLSRPEKRNAISIHMIAELQAALDEIEKTHTRVVILTGSGKAFCAGIHIWIYGSEDRLFASHRFRFPDATGGRKACTRSAAHWPALASPRSKGV